MDTKELYDRGLALRKKMLGDEQVEKRMASFGEFGEPLQYLINAYAYGDVWNRDNLPLKTRSLVMVGIAAALNRQHELKVHIQGALKNGCTAPELQDVMLLIAMYCGIPASNDAHRVVTEVMESSAKKG